MVPDGTSNATIGGAGTETITVSGNRAVNFLTLADMNATLAVTNGATLSAHGGLAISAVQEIDVTNGTLPVGDGSQTPDSATINLGSTTQHWWGTQYQPGTLTTETASQHSVVFTLGPNLTINAIDGQLNSGSDAGDGIIKQATINDTGNFKCMRPQSCIPRHSLG